MTVRTSTSGASTDGTGAAGRRGRDSKGSVRARRVVAAAMLAGSIATVWAQSPVAASKSVAKGEAASRVPPDSLSTLLFEVVMAEIAVQRGQLGAAYATLLSVANDTGDARIARRAVEIAIGARAGEDALTATRVWAQLAPADREADSTLIGLLIETGRFSEAEPRIAPRIKAAPMPAAAFDEVQRLYARASNRSEALASLTRLAQPYPNDAAVRLALARMAFVAGNNDRAVAESRKALELDPHSELAALTTAQLLGRSAPDQGIAVLQDFVKNNPTSTEASTALARALAVAGRTDEARAVLQSVVDKQPSNLDALLALGGISYQARDLDAAQAQLKRYLDRAKQTEADPRDVNAAYFTLSEIAEDRRHYDEAIGWMQQLDASSPAVPVKSRIAQLLAKSGRVDEGLAQLQAMTPRDDAERQQIVSAQALALREAKRYQAAFDTLAAAVKATPDSPELLYDYALAAEKIDRVADMERALRKVIELRPAEAQAYNALGYSLADRRLRLDEARSLVEKALTISPDDPFIVDSMGWVEYRAGNTTRAIELLERAYKLRADPEIAAHLGEVLWVGGDRPRATALWRTARERDPNNETLAQTLARYHQP